MSSNKPLKHFSGKSLLNELAPALVLAEIAIANLRNEYPRPFEVNEAIDARYDDLRKNGENLKYHTSLLYNLIGQLKYEEFIERNSEAHDSYKITQKGFEYMQSEFEQLVGFAGRLQSLYENEITGIKKEKRDEFFKRT